MSVNNIDQVLAQMRVIKAQAMGNPELSAPGISSASFSNLLKHSIDSVNQTQIQASEMKQAFELGGKEVSLAEVMVAVQKSDISFEAMVQVRNKLIDAYKEVMNMPI
ncbi:MAG: flagellar hook-basal body complex protein FliE [Gammaproteobacteria bacterium]|nr:flagellar hook-basal body complex protein FliE [Gammaproteobacteria bacterium]MCP5406673.1 flagellar hook-basal body complex protein FliE [Chromatiaceae bacterium]MCP5410380.1 flagellar hook-basal body complex protein FliE [Chromatiaceae bacterium]MCP5444401.1 flagellar hook-basal body complex protein FliE [Chromatiaceae bacterium]